LPAQTKTSYDFIENQQRAILPAQRLDPFQITGLRRLKRNRFHDDAGDLTRVLAKQSC
jgi:hypothetical protein